MKEVNPVGELSDQILNPETREVSVDERLLATAIRIKKLLDASKESFRHTGSSEEEKQLALDNREIIEREFAEFVKLSTPHIKSSLQGYSSKADYGANIDDIVQEIFASFFKNIDRNLEKIFKANRDEEKPSGFRESPSVLAFFVTIGKRRIKSKIRDRLTQKRNSGTEVLSMKSDEYSSPRSVEPSEEIALREAQDRLYKAIGVTERLREVIAKKSGDHQQYMTEVINEVMREDCPISRKAFLLYTFTDLQQKEIAEKLNIKNSHAQKLIQRERIALKSIKKTGFKKIDSFLEQDE